MGGCNENHLKIFPVLSIKKQQQIAIVSIKDSPNGKKQVENGNYNDHEKADAKCFDTSFQVVLIVHATSFLYVYDRLKAPNNRENT